MKTRFAPLSILCLLTLGGVVSCNRHGAIEVVSAEFQDEHPDGLARQHESILVTLSRPLPPGLPAGKISVYSSPGTEWTATVEATPNPKKLLVRIETGTPDLQLQGIHGVEPDAGGLGLDLGDGNVQWVDLQLQQSLPVLEKVVWEDQPSNRGNRVADQGDRLRLVFDRPVMLNGETTDGPMLVSSRDVILSKANDRLDDGNVRAYFEGGDSLREVHIVLGSGAILQIDGEILSESSGIERFQLNSPSGLALNGTAVIPMPKITDRRGGRGAISKRELDIRFPEGFAVPRARAGESFPEPRTRMFHTVTATGWSAYVVGGRAVENAEVLDEVLVYNPFHDESHSHPFTVCDGRLASPTMHHTATALPGPDGFLNTADDVIVVVGGTDGDQPLAHITLIHSRTTDMSEATVVTLKERLVVPRREHAALAVDANTVLVDGGFGPRGGIVGCAERLTFRYEGDNIYLDEHVAFRTLARTHHTLTLLPESKSGASLVLAYGGYGRDRRRLPLPEATYGRPVMSASENEIYFSYLDGSVLVSPVLLNVKNPERSTTRLEYDFRFALLRSRHVAAPLLPASPPASAKLPVADTVLLAGGTSSHPIGRFDGGVNLWEMPVLPTLPQGHETSSAVLFRFNREEPQKSRFEVVAHPAPDPGQVPERTFLSAVAVPGYGVVLAGGEPSGDWPDKPRASVIEVFLNGSERLASAAAWLSTPRARSAGYLVNEQGIRSIFLIGGLSSDGQATALSAVEEIPLPTPE
jgi:hypothetical protein